MRQRTRRNVIDCSAITSLPSHFHYYGKDQKKKGKFVDLLLRKLNDVGKRKILNTWNISYVLRNLINKFKR